MSNVSGIEKEFSTEAFSLPFDEYCNTFVQICALNNATPLIRVLKYVSSWCLMLGIHAARFKLLRRFRWCFIGSW